MPEVRARDGKLLRLTGPLRLVLLAAGAIFAGEIAVMAVLSQLDLQTGTEAVIDSILLTALVAPVLYFTMFRPLQRELRGRGLAEEARGAALGAVARGSSLLLALGRAAEAVQRARTQDEVYRAVGDEVVRLGHHAMLFTVTADQEHLELSLVTFEAAPLRAAETLVGVSAQGYRFPLAQGGVYRRTMAEGRTAFSERVSEHVAEALPWAARPLAGRIVATLGLDQSILAPLKTGSEVGGLLWVAGAGLTEADIPAVTVFANQTSIALENVRLYQGALQRVERTETEVKALRDLLPICASCKRIRGEDGGWQPVESYIRDRSNTEFSHGMCDECGKRLYGDLWEER